MDRCNAGKKLAEIFSLAACMLFISGGTAVSGEDLVSALKSAGGVLMIRHARAPGTGDPDDFTIGDCTTQRNLDDRGREQARRIGQWLRDRGIDSARVFSSQWCRCLETAELMSLGPVTPLPALNSFFERPRDREPNLAALRDFLAQQPADGELIVLVTHFVTISAVTGRGVSSGEGVVMRLKGDGGFEILGELDFADRSPNPTSP
jgi:phosphohistidine phosphatase SixA